MNTFGPIKHLVLGKLDPSARTAAFAPEPTMLPTTDILFDAWALTTIREKLPGRPPVEPYLHGLSERERPETHVAWREELSVITGALVEQQKPEDLLEDYPLKPHELLRDRSDRVFKHLAVIAERDGDKPVWLVDDNGNVQVFTLRELADKGNRSRINYCTVLLPPSVGGLENGLLKGKSNDADDVAGEWFADKDKIIRRRIRVWDDDVAPARMRLIRAIDTNPNADELEEEGETPVRRYWYWHELSRRPPPGGTSRWDSSTPPWP